MKLLRILLLLLLPAIAFSELPIIEPTLVEGEYNVYNKQSFMHHLEAEKSLIFYSENEDGNPTLFAYSDDLSEVKKIKEFESKFYTEINFVPTQLDIAIFYVIDTI